MLDPKPLVPPMRDIKLYHYRNTMAIEEGQGLPALDQTQWSTQIRFIVRREANP
jgi:hypothetical protein